MVLVPDVVVAVVLVVVLVVIFVVALFFCHFSSARPGGMREAIESGHRALGATVGAVWCIVALSYKTLPPIAERYPPPPGPSPIPPDHVKLEVFASGPRC